MENWQIFENSCVKYLNNLYGKYATFTNEGGANSTTSDIFVKTNKDSFYIEVKEPNAQSGQFVLLPDISQNKFKFSPRNKSEPNKFTGIITKYMDNNFEHFNSAGTAGQNLDIDSHILCDWIEDYYTSKGVKYFITKGDDFIIFPISRFSFYFKVSAKYRIKRSGSSEPAIKDRALVLDTLKSNYGIIDHTIIGKKLFISKENSLNSVRFTIGNYEYYLAHKQDNEYEIRKLSNTYNMNVIFSVSLKSAQQYDDLKDFEDFIS